MVVKSYQYSIQRDKVDEFLAIQEESAAIYRQHLAFHTMYLNSTEDESKWIEMTFYQNEENYQQGIESINKESEIHILFEKFQSLLCPENNQILEESFVIKKEIHAFK